MASTRNSTFLSLPRELRDCVYLHFLNECIVVPPQTPEKANRYKSRFDVRTGKTCIPVSLDRPSIALLRCCHQTRHEIQELVQREDRNRKSPSIFRLDCMVVGRHAIYPTWILLPTIVTKVSRLEVDARIFEPEYKDISWEFVVSFRPFWQLLRLLLHYSPHFHEDVSTSPVYFETLVINLASDFKVESQHDSHQLETPEISFEQLVDGLEGLERYGLLFGKIGRLEVCYGTERRVISVEKRNQRVATISLWDAWFYRWRSDPSFHPSHL